MRSWKLDFVLSTGSTGYFKNRRRFRHVIRRCQKKTARFIIFSAAMQLQQLSSEKSKSVSKF